MIHLVSATNQDPTVGTILRAFCTTFESQVAKRVYFYKSSRLLQKGLVNIVSDRSSSNGSDLTQHTCSIDKRILDCIMGLDNESSEVAEGSNLYTPKSHMKDCILPAELKDSVLKQVNDFAKYREYHATRAADADGWTDQKKGLVLMFCGPSGTGKTMTANALASEIKKKVLLVNFPMLQSRAEFNGRDENSSSFRSIFREAELSDAVVFRRVRVSSHRADAEDRCP